MLYGIAPGLARGQLHPRAVALYNALHRFWGPLVLVMVALAVGLPLGYVAGAIAWGFHVAFDRATGCGCVHPTVFSGQTATRRAARSLNPIEGRM